MDLAKPHLDVGLSTNLREPLSAAPACGIVRVRIARAGLAAPRELADPDGNFIEISQRASLVGHLD